ncbi:hypothetical protein E2C01_071721 [Portunus trituberculatus]|uniref:Uncharacterized protein n=1 Tax=Portunus trituberculatus TaxID=210409 RepID=A0A5B7HXR6_PORTR|nr:hypothetical protein [Portunus trituberculatus]
MNGFIAGEYCNLSQQLMPGHPRLHIERRRWLGAWSDFLIDPQPLQQHSGLSCHPPPHRPEGGM